MDNELSYEYREYTQRGRTAEDRFVQTVKRIKPDVVVVKATEDVDMAEHWDYSFDGVRIDVKARRNIGMLNANGDKYTNVEFVNRLGKKGWLYGDADYIAFEMITEYLDCFIVVPRKELVKYAERVVKNEFVTDANHSVNKKYQGFNTKYVISAVSLNEISMLPNGKLIMNKV